jgi:hypothetical protein
MMVMTAGKGKGAVMTKAPSKKMMEIIPIIWELPKSSVIATVILPATNAQIRRHARTTMVFTAAVDAIGIFISTVSNGHRNQLQQKHRLDPLGPLGERRERVLF